MANIKPYPALKSIAYEPTNEPFLEKNEQKTDYQVIIQEIDKASCQFCGLRKGTIEITDSETLQQVYICEVCDDSLDFRNCKELTPAQEDYILEQGLEIAREKREEQAREIKQELLEQKGFDYGRGLEYD